jgi:hypothetical protein
MLANYAEDVLLWKKSVTFHHLLIEKSHTLMIGLFWTFFILFPSLYMIAGSILLFLKNDLILSFVIQAQNSFKKKVSEGGSRAHIQKYKTNFAFLQKNMKQYIGVHDVIEQVASTPD